MLVVGERKVSADKVGNSPARLDVAKRSNNIDKQVHICICWEFNCSSCRFVL